MYYEIVITLQDVLRGYIFQKLLRAWILSCINKTCFLSRRRIPLATLLVWTEEKKLRQCICVQSTFIVISYYFLLYIVTAFKQSKMDLHTHMHFKWKWRKNTQKTTKFTCCNVLPCIISWNDLKYKMILRNALNIYANNKYKSAKKSASLVLLLWLSDSDTLTIDNCVTLSKWLN